MGAVVNASVDPIEIVATLEELAVGMCVVVIVVQGGGARSVHSHAGLDVRAVLDPSGRVVIYDGDRTVAAYAGHYLVQVARPEVHGGALIPTRIIDLARSMINA